MYLLLFTVARIILQLDNSAEGPWSCISMVAPSGFVFFAATCRSTTVQRDCCLPRHLCLCERPTPPPPKLLRYTSSAYLSKLPEQLLACQEDVCAMEIYRCKKYTVSSENILYDIMSSVYSILFYNCGGGLASNKIRK